MSALPRHPEDIHPALWRASQLAAGFDRVVSCGHAALAAELPGGGWPAGALTELLTPQPGCGELRLLRPALATVGSRPLLLLQAPHRLQPAGLKWLGIPAAQACALHVLVFTIAASRVNDSASAEWGIKRRICRARRRKDMHPTVL